MFILTALYSKECVIPNSVLFLHVDVWCLEESYLDADLMKSVHATISSAPVFKFSFVPMV